MAQYDPAVRLQNLLRVSASGIHGRGVFASKAIPSGTFLGTYEGKTTRRNSKYVLWVEDENGETTARVGTPPLKYLNHSAEPNSYFDGFDLFAQRDIEAGEEITFHYGEEGAFE